MHEAKKTVIQFTIVLAITLASLPLLAENNWLAMVTAAWLTFPYAGQQIQ